MADLRKLMKERAATKRIDHPYARYSNSGSLTCSLCSLAVKSDVLWPSHLTSKVHRSNVQKQKDVQEQEQEQLLLAQQEEKSLKRPQSDNIDPENDEPETGAKKPRIDDSNIDTEATQAGPSSFLPPGFFDDPSQTASTSQAEDIDGDANGNGAKGQVQEEDDPEWAAFEATLAESDAQQASTSNLAGPSNYASATISAGEVMYNNGDEEDGQQGQNGQDLEDDEEEEEAKETEEERREREEREELMERIETEEREQQEADERVNALKRRLSAIRAAKKSGKDTARPDSPSTTQAEPPSSAAHQRRHRRLRNNA